MYVTALHIYLMLYVSVFIVILYFVSFTVCVYYSWQGLVRVGLS